MRLLTTLTVLALAAGCSSTGHTPPTQTPPRTPAPSLPRLVPVSVEVPQLGAHSDLVALGLNPDRSLETPDVAHPEQAGFYCVKDPVRTCSSGVLPGQVGPAVVIGHIDGNHGQKGVFHDLPTLKPGDTASVTESDGSVLTFSVYRVLSTAKTQFENSVVYGNTTLPELRLITCSGPFVGGTLGYSDNTVVFLVLVPTTPG